MPHGAFIQNSRQPSPFRRGIAQCLPPDSFILHAKINRHLRCCGTDGGDYGAVQLDPQWLEITLLSIQTIDKFTVNHIGSGKALRDDAFQSRHESKGSQADPHHPVGGNRFEKLIDNQLVLLATVFVY